MREITAHNLGPSCLVLLTHLALAMVALASDSGPEANQSQVHIPQLDPTVQASIRGLLSTSEEEMFSGTKEAFREKLNRLRKLAGGDAELVLQLLRFSVQARGMKEAMLPGVVMEQLKIPKATIATAVLPVLETKDEALRKAASNWLAGTDESPTRKGVDFSRYETILRKEKPSIPLGLIRYMYDRNPGSALLTVGRVYGDKGSEADVTAKLEHNAKLKHDAKLKYDAIAARLQHDALAIKLEHDALAAKSRHDLRGTWDYFLNRSEWWAHLYVATEMKKRPELRSFEYSKRDAQIVKQLEKDDHPLVREAVAEIKPCQEQTE